MFLWMAVHQGSCEDEHQGPQVIVAQGALRGLVLETRGGRQVHAFLGIPYATPPVGPLRFHVSSLNLTISDSKLIYLYKLILI